jgi:hypothetical protein
MMVAQSGARPDVLPVSAIIVQISWAMLRTCTPLTTSRSPWFASKNARTLGRSAWSTKSMPPAVPRAAPGSMSTFGLSNAVANTRVGSQPPLLNTNRNLRSVAETGSAQARRAGRERPAAVAMEAPRSWRRFILGWLMIGPPGQ